MTKIEEYRARARECELRAGQVHDLEVRQQFVELARQWHHMAAQWAELLGGTRTIGWFGMLADEVIE